MKKFFLMSTLLFLQATSSLYAQKDYGTDSIKCHEFLHIYNNEYQMGARAEVYEAWKVVYDICPASSKNNFIFGPAILKARIKVEKSDSVKTELVNTLIDLYDKRLEFFPEKYTYVKSLQALDMLKYKSHPIDEIYARFQSLNSEGSRSKSAAFYNGYLIAASKAYNKKHIEKLELFEAYNEILEGIEFNNNKLNSEIHSLAIKIESESINTLEEKQLEKLNQQLKVYDKVEANAGILFDKVADCNWLGEIYNEESFEKNKDNPAWINRASKSLLKQRGREAEDCSMNPIFYRVVEAQLQLEPKAQSYRALAQLALSKEDKNKALDAFNKALELELDPKKQALDYYNIAVVQLQLNHLPEAKIASLKAAGLKSKWGEPFILLAQIYARAEGVCGSNVCENKAVYWAAIDKLKYAKKIDPSVANRVDAQIDIYKKNVPRINLCHMKNTSEGDEILIGCWINETVTARFYKG